MRIFVTGALGFIGAHFIERALAVGHEIVGIYRRADAEKAELLRTFTAQGAKLVQGNVLDPDGYAPLLAGADCICHFAAAFKGSNHTEEEFTRINVTGMERVLSAGAAAGVRRFVLCSTAGIYGQSLAGIADESALPQPWNAYERSKYAAEKSLREHAPSLGIEFVILRPSVVYGPRDDRLLKLFRAAAKGRFPLFGPGEGRRHMVYVTDVADAFLLGCTSSSAANEDMIIAGPHATRLRELLDVLADIVQRKRCGPRLPLAPMLLLAAMVEDGCKLVGIDPPLYRRRMDFYRSDAAFDCSRAQQLLGWTPRVDLREGLRQTYLASRVERSLVPETANIAVAITLLCDFPWQPLWWSI